MAPRKTPKAIYNHVRRVIAEHSVPRQHDWHLRFDRVVCRNCDAKFTESDDVKRTGATNIRPQAGIRQRDEGRA